MHAQFVDFPTPRNLNYWWTFGGILTFMLVAQIVTGIVLAMHYQPSAAGAFDSVDRIRRDVSYGDLIRNLHAVGASMFFLAAYVHIFRGLYYGSYKAPREVLWIIGVFIFVVMMATAFMGYSLPWGQMSFWGVTVITNLFSSLDSIWKGLGTTIVEWLWGGYSVTGVTLNRFYSLHYLLPFVIAGLVALHLWALHVVGQNSPTGLDIKTTSDAVPMTPLRDLEGRGRHVRLPAAVRVFRVLPAGLSRSRRQLHSGRSAGHAAAHRARMVLPAVLRDPARHPLEADRRHRHVLGDHRAAVRPLARHQPRALDQVSSGVPLVLLAVRVQRRRPRLARLQAAGCRVRVLGARVHHLLLRALPRGHAARRLAGDAAQSARIDHRGGARHDNKPPSWRRPRPDRGLA